MNKLLLICATLILLIGCSSTDEEEQPREWDIDTTRNVQPIGCAELKERMKKEGKEADC